MEPGCIWMQVKTEDITDTSVATSTRLIASLHCGHISVLRVANRKEHVWSLVLHTPTGKGCPCEIACRYKCHSLAIFLLVQELKEALLITNYAITK